jgi:putative membrane protein
MTSKNIRLMVFCLGGLLIAGPSLAAEPTAPATADVLGALHRSNVKEMRMGKMAVAHGRSEDVRSFGETLIADHDNIDTKVAALAKSEDIVLAAHTPAVGTLTMTMGPGFDAAFARSMLADHQRDVAALKTARDTTGDEQLRRLLIGVLPVLENHLATAQKLVDQGARS